jgi:bifunctional non-homologous end joining protein LigD
MNPLHRRNHDGAPASTHWELIAAVASHFIEPCLPSPGERPPTGPDWVHEIKHDGYRLMARRDALSVGIRLLTKNGHDWASRYPLIVRAVNKLKVRSCLIDGEAVCCNERGMASFDKLRHRSHDPEVFLVAFDLLELDGQDLRREPLEVRKQTLASLLRGSLPGVQFNAHLTGSRRHRVRECLQDGAGGHRVKAVGFDLPFWAFTRLAQVQEPGSTGG